jgi:hypothetical protein
VRSIPEQVCPAFAKPPQTQPEIAFARSASAQTICGSLPPSSSTEPLRRRAQISPTLRPTSTEPVKKIFRADDSQSASPIAPPPWTTRTSPSGSPARSNVSRMRSPSSGVRLAGFRTTPLPAMSAIATSSKGIAHG